MKGTHSKTFLFFFFFFFRRLARGESIDIYSMGRGEREREREREREGAGFNTQQDEDYMPEEVVVELVHAPGAERSWRGRHLELLHRSVVCLAIVFSWNIAGVLV